LDSLKLLVVFAHPDDESMGMGGTLAKYSAQGVDTHLVCASRGERGWFGPAEQNPGFESLGQTRTIELGNAVNTLGMKSLNFLGYMDGDVDKADHAEAISQIVTHMRRIKPQVVVTFPPDGNYGHPDHIAIGRFTTEVFHRALGVVALHTIAVQYSLANELGMTQIHAVPDDAITLTVDVSTVWDAKMAAIHCHQTQLGESPILRASPEKQHLFLGTEHFQTALFRPDLLVKSKQSNSQTLMSF